VKYRVTGRNVNASVLKRTENSNWKGSNKPTRGEAKGPRERKEREGSLTL